MSDLIPKLARNTLIRAGGPIAPKALAKAAEKAMKAAVDPAVIAKALEATVDLKSIGKVAEKALETTAKTALTPEVAKRTAQLLDTNAAMVLPSDASKLIGLAKAGTLSPEAGLTLSLGNVSQKVAQSGGFAAVVLSDEGKKALAMAQQGAGLDAALSKLGLTSYANSGLRFGAETALPISLDLGRSAKHVLVDAKDHTELLKQYGEAVARGEAPAAIGGTPFTKFFKASDDLYNDLEVEAFQRAVPGFAQRPIDEQKAIASLAGRVAADFPADLPAATRRRVAASMVTYLPVEGAPTGIKAIDELKAFYKGVPAGKGPSVADRIAQEGLRVGEPGRYGKGVYHTPSPTTASGYTYRNVSTPAEMVSGEVAPGRSIEGRMAGNFDQLADVDTRWIRRLDLDKADFGDYGVTKDPSRFRIKAITRYRPDQATGLENLIPDLLETHRQAPGWTAKLFDRMDPARRERAFEYALQKGTPEARQSAAFLLARSGDAKGIQLTVETLRRATDSKTTNAAGEALRGAFSFLGDRAPEAGSILQVLSGSTYLKGKESTIAKEVESSLGDTGTKLLEANGWKRASSGPRTYWTR